MDNQQKAENLYKTGYMLIWGRKKSVDKAIKCIQKAIALDDRNFKYLQLLGEAYYQRGSLNPAINCFIKSTEFLLENNDASKLPQDLKTLLIYSKIRISDLRSNIGEYLLAIDGYNEIILIDSNNLAAHLGIAKCEIQLSKESFSNDLRSEGIEYCYSALKRSITAINLSPGSGIGWKLASDCCLQLSIYGKENDFDKNLNDIGLTSNQSDKLTKLQCLILSEKFLCKILTNPTFHKSANLWHNLGTTLILKSDNIIDNEADRRIVLSHSLKCLLMALNIDPDSSQIRNSLGVLVAKLGNNAIAQHLLISSMKKSLSTHETQLFNIALMVMNENKSDVARLLLQKCQAEEPLSLVADKAKRVIKALDESC